MKKNQKIKAEQNLLKFCINILKMINSLRSDSIIFLTHIKLNLLTQIL